MIRSHRIRLDPTEEQAKLFHRHAGLARLAYNWAVGEFKASLDLQDWCNHYELRRRFNTIKSHQWPWWTELSTNPSKGAIINAGEAIQRWGQYRRDIKDGKPTPKVGFPKYKKRGSTPTFRADRGEGEVKFVEQQMFLSKKMGGTVKMRQALRWKGRITRVNMSKKAGHWYASVSVDDGIPLPETADNGKPAIGIDMGLKTLAVCSDGTEYANPKPLAELLPRLRKADKALQRKVEGSNNWHKQVAAVQKLHARIADLRTDYAHKATTEIVSNAGSISVENLNIAGMKKNRKLSRAFADAGIGEFLRQLEYKSAWNGIPFRRINRWYPSSKSCHHCKSVNNTLSLAMREWQCENCGAILNRDYNAALNIRDYEEPAGGYSVAACGDLVKPNLAVGTDEAGTSKLHRQLRP